MPDALTIGILNNMADAGVRVTEHQFRDLLTEAAGSARPINVRWFSPSPREGYEPIGALWNEHHLDGLIVTGTEPRNRSLRNESCWPDLVATIEWAAAATVSTIWSCLAAHAAVLKLDSIDRCLLPSKLSGLYETTKVAYHPLVAGTGDRWHSPHSRYNDLAPLPLILAGYRIVTSSSSAGADIFIKPVQGSLFIFMQGHPEYDARALMREYRRDVQRFLNGEQRHHPDIPIGYFDAKTEDTLRHLRQQALWTGNAGLMHQVKLAVGAAELTASWRPAAVRVYQNWLSILEKQADRAAATSAAMPDAIVPT
jgi:homoserine O-succinyltransferase